MVSSTYVYGTRIEVLYHHLIRFVVRSGDQLNKRYGHCVSAKYYCLIVSVHETANHRLKSNVYDMLSAAISLDSYIMTICPGHAWSYCYFLQSWTLYSAGFVLSCCLWTIDGRRSWRLTGTHLWYACDSLCRRRTMITPRTNQWFINNVRYA